jgi:hypothetical protein
MTKVLLAAVVLTAGVPGPPETSALRAVRFARNACERRLGPVSVKLVENGGDVALAALQSCTPPTGRRLCMFFNDGRAEKLDFDALLACIARPGNGEEVAAWAMAHAADLEDPAAFQAYVNDPLPIALRLKPLDSMVAEFREGERVRESAAEAAQQPWRTPELSPWLLPAGVLVVGAVVVALKRRRAAKTAG